LRHPDDRREEGSSHFFLYKKSASGDLLEALVVGVWMFLILSDYKLDCFRKKSPTSVGLFMDKKSMMRNRVED
jgi:hypothetical protein